MTTLSSVPVFFMTDSERKFHQIFALFGLFFIAIGAGGIKPCVISFGADQFETDQVEAKERYFKMFYMMINLGALISSFLTPVLRQFDCYPQTKDDTLVVDTFGDNIGQRLAFDSCHVAGYGVPAALMIISYTFFMLPNFLSRQNPEKFPTEDFEYKIWKPAPGSNLVFRYVKAIGSGLTNKIRSCFSGTNDHAQATNDKTLEGFLNVSSENNIYIRRNAYRFLGLCQILIPMCIFFAIFDQIGSIWTFQAKDLDGWVSENYYVLPDQVEVLNCVFVITMIPLWVAFSPVLDKIIFNKSELLKRNKPFILMGFGIALAGVAQMLATWLQLKIDNSRELLTLVTLNYDENVLTFGEFDNVDGFTVEHPISIVDGLNTVSDNGQDRQEEARHMLELNVAYPSKSTVLSAKYHLELTNPQERGMVNLLEINAESAKLQTSFSGMSRDVFELELLDAENSEDTFYQNSAFYIKYNNEIHQLATGRTFPYLYIVPQYLIVTLAEILVSITALEFGYTQSSKTMKSLINSFWLLTQSFGNVIIILMKSLMKDYSRAEQLLSSAGMALITTLIFSFMCRGFIVMTPAQVEHILEEDTDGGESGQKKRYHQGYSEVVGNDDSSVSLVNKKDPMYRIVPIVQPASVLSSAVTVSTTADSHVSLLGRNQDRQNKLVVEHRGDVVKDDVRIQNTPTH